MSELIRMQPVENYSGVSIRKAANGWIFTADDGDEATEEFVFTTDLAMVAGLIDLGILSHDLLRTAMGGQIQKGRKVEGKADVLQVQ